MQCRWNVCPHLSCVRVFVCAREERVRACVLHVGKFTLEGGHSHKSSSGAVCCKNAGEVCETLSCKKVCTRADVRGVCKRVSGKNAGEVCKRAAYSTL